MSTLEEKVYIYIYDNDTNNYLRSETHTLTEEISGSSFVPAETLAYKTYGTTYALKTCIVTSGSNAGTHFGQDTLALPDDGKITLHFVNRKYVADFSWTDDDAAKIKEGELPSNLKASAIKKVIDLLEGDLDRIWWSKSTLPDVSSGDEITRDTIVAIGANIWRTVLCVVGLDEGFKYRGFTSSSVKTGAPIRATQFANHEYSMKSAINKIIQYLRP